jgi:hypothetical protein
MESDGIPALILSDGVRWILNNTPPRPSSPGSLTPPKGLLF